MVEGSDSGRNRHRRLPLQLYGWSELGCRRHQPNYRRHPALDTQGTVPPDHRDAIRLRTEGSLAFRLDGNQVPLGKFEGLEIDLGDAEVERVRKWEDLELAQGKQLKQII